jgi:hypothetical protein
MNSQNRDGGPGQVQRLVRRSLLWPMASHSDIAHQPAIVGLGRA